MKVSLDGGLHFTTAPNGIVVVQEVDVPGEDDTAGELHITVNDEGVVLDVWCSRESSLDHNIGTSSETFDEIVDRLVEEGE